MTRQEILTQAAECVCKDREEQYGTPEDSLSLIAALWNAYLGDRVTDDHDVAVMMALLKIARIASGQTKADNYVDLAGYAACAGEIGLRGEEPEKCTFV